MPKFKPSVSYQYKEFSNSFPREVGFTKPTYAEIKKNMRKYLADSYDGIVRVYRSRRGEWGEWFEHWRADDKGKPYITKQGWQ